MKCERKLDIYRYLLCIKSKWRPNMQYVFTMWTKRIRILSYSSLLAMFQCSSFWIHFLVSFWARSHSFFFAKRYTVKIYVALLLFLHGFLSLQSADNIMFYYYCYLCGKHIVFGMQYIYRWYICAYEWW